MTQFVFLPNTMARLNNDMLVGSSLPLPSYFEATLLPYLQLYDFNGDQETVLLLHYSPQSSLFVRQWGGMGMGGIGRVVTGSFMIRRGD